MELISKQELWSDIMMLPHNGDIISSEEVEQAIINARAIDAVSKGLFDQYKWERDIAIAQLEEIGLGLGEKITDIVKVVRCKDCRYFEPDEICSVYSGTCWHCEMVKKFNDFCSYGKR